MTITNSTRLVTYTGNGVTTEFDFTFLIPTGALVVTLYEIATGVEGAPLSDALYSATGLDDATGGTVTYPLVGSPLAATHKINIKRDVAATQDLNLTNQSPYFPEELEEQLDRIVMMIQQNEETLDRAVTVVPGSGIDPANLIDDLTTASAAAVAAAAAAALDAAAAAASAIAAAASAGTFTTVPVQVVVGAAKATPVDADLIGIVETAGPVLKKTTWLQAWTNYFKVKADAVYLALTGGTLTGDLSVTKSSPQISLIKSASGQTAAIAGLNGANTRWLMEIGNADTESGSNAGSRFILSRYNDAGAYLDSPLYITRDADPIYLPKGQINFPTTQNASSDANTLDDYEEGTFTPAFAATGSTFVYGTQYGSYTKIGNRVSGNIFLQLGAGNTLSANTLTITGMPFTSGESQLCYFSPRWAGSTTSYVNMTASLAAGASVLTISALTAAAINFTVQNANAALANNGLIALNFSYKV